MNELRRRLDEYARRPATRSGAAERVYAERLDLGLAINMAEGFAPMAEDQEILHLLASGRVSLEEAKGLCRLLTDTMPMSSRGRIASATALD